MGQHLSRIALVFAVLATAAGMVAWSRAQNRTVLANTRVDQWIASAPAELPIAADLLRIDPRAAGASLRRREQAADLTSAVQTRIDLGLAMLQAAEPSRLQRLAHHAPAASVKDLCILRMALEQSGDDCRSILHQAFEHSDSPETRSKLAILLFHLDSPDSLTLCLDYQTSPDTSLLATHLIGEDDDAFSDYLTYLSSKVQRSSQHDLLASMVKGLGLRSTTSLTNATREAWCNLLRTLFHESPSGPMHSAAEYALNSMGEQPNADALPEMRQFPRDRDWMISPCGLTFVRIPAQGQLLRKEMFQQQFFQKPMDEVRLSDFWMCTTELPAKLFAEFAELPEAKPYIDEDYEPRDGDQPVSSIRILEALAFCNWLSERDGLEPFYVEGDEPYQLMGEEKVMFGSEAALKQLENMRRWSINRESSGYRLPAFDELVFAPYGATLPEFSDPRRARDILKQYAWFSENSQGVRSPSEMHRGGQLLPNIFGLFDIVGNGSEVAIDTREQYLSLEHAVLNSCFSSNLQSVSSLEQMPTYFWLTDETRSMRLVRSVR